MKFICGTGIREKLILCTDFRADQTPKMTSLQKTDEKMIAVCSDELVAKGAYCRWTCSRSLTRDYLINRNTEEQSVDESSAF